MEPTSNPLQSQAQTTSERWRTLVPKYERIIEEEGLDRWYMPEMLAKATTGEIKGGKGIFLLGNTGCGKTRRLKILSEQLLIPMWDSIRLVNELRRDDTKDHFEYVCNLPVFGNCSRHHYDFIIDDLGAESGDNRSYGNRRDIMGEVLNERYMCFPRFKTHFSSNLPLEAIRASYGERLWSRLNEMCVFITLPGEDRRITHDKEEL